MAEQLGFAEALVDRRLGSNAKLARIDQLIEWARLGALVAPLRSGETGRPPYDALAMMKALYDPVGSGARGSAAGSAVVSAFLRVRPGAGKAQRIPPSG